MAILQERFKRVVEQSRTERQHVRRLVSEKRFREAEPDPVRFTNFMMKSAALSLPRGRESQVGETLDLQGAWFLPGGARINRAVAYVEVTDGRRSGAGSGSLVSWQLFLTNQHVIANADAARGAQIVFDRQTVPGRPSPTTIFILDPDRFALFSKEEELDYALLAVGARISGEATLEDLHYCALSDREDKHILGMNVNIIQHPFGWPKMIAVRNNLLTHRTKRTLLYETDTDHGSSGAPVFNDDWELVALHHYGEPFLERTDDLGRPIESTVNEGVRISAIYRDLVEKLGALPAEQQVLLRSALELGRQAPSDRVRKLLGPPRPGGESAEGLPVISSQGEVMTESSSSRDLRVVIPIEVVVRVGAVGTTAAMDHVSVERTLKTLRRGAERLPIDDDYSNRDGYDPQFIAGVALPLPIPNAKLAKQIAPLRAGEPNADAGELKYEHFSIKMNKSKRIAMFTATNIDGAAYLNVDRVSGEVTDEGAEAETWYKDPRISNSFFLDQTFYSEWSNYFDRGHLTRRVDPNWGSKDEAERANADTYHFTNCSPQHFRFNQTTKFWQGAERYILENGALSEESQNRISVFQGPIFNDKVDHMADDVQIPSSFFKVIVWKGKRGLRSVGLIVDQLALLSEERKALGKPKPVEFVNVSQWRVPIESIEQRTGLNFGAVVKQADTISDERQPRVGEAQILIKAIEDILPR